SGWKRDYSNHDEFLSAEELATGAKSHDPHLQALATSMLFLYDQLVVASDDELGWETNGISLGDLMTMQCRRDGGGLPPIPLAGFETEGEVWGDSGRPAPSGKPFTSNNRLQQGRKFMGHPGLEPGTSPLSGVRSSHLS